VVSIAEPAAKEEPDAEGVADGRGRWWHQQRPPMQLPTERPMMVRAARPADVVTNVKADSAGDGAASVKSSMGDIMVVDFSRLNRI